jgi:hypothetical protein
MSHLNEIRETYFHHMKFAWTVAFVLIVHGVLPNVWTESVRHDGRVGEETSVIYLRQ